MVYLLITYFFQLFGLGLVNAGNTKNSTKMNVGVNSDKRLAPAPPAKTGSREQVKMNAMPWFHGKVRCSNQRETFYTNVFCALF